MVSSLNGKITRGDNLPITSWTSTEDKAHFKSMIEKYDLLVMGSRTYESAKESMDLSQNKLRIVLTRNAEKYKEEEVPNKLLFSNETPSQLVTRLEQEGHTEMLLLGGGEINSLFVKENLIDELYLTVEPVIFGQGKRVFADGDFGAKAELVSLEKLNSQGTLLLHYSFKK